jgi:hypothetical protein
MRTSPSFCGQPYRRPGSRSIATMPDARADRVPMWAVPPLRRRARRARSKREDASGQPA